MSFVLTPFTRQLQFAFTAKTSRGALQVHQANYLRLHHTQNPAQQGWGECSPLPGLSPDFTPSFYSEVEDLCQLFNKLQIESAEDPRQNDFWNSLLLKPSVRFAWETAWLDFLRGGKRNLFDSPFARGEEGIKINGLVWMGDPAFMRRQIEQKLAQGYSCLKMKIGGLDFNQELRILSEIREVAGADQLELRLDANGAFAAKDAEEKLRRLAQFAVHSIEQPIMAGQKEALQQLCQVSPIPIALDEELIGISNTEDFWPLLNMIRPQYIILKPTLLGGLQVCRSWIKAAESLGIKWWLTSALESNIGLNAIAQFAADTENPLPQGLGTGQLYLNNLASGLEIKGEKLWYDPSLKWELPA